MNFLEAMPTIPRIRPSFNQGCLFDIPTGTYHLGKRGNSILNSGMCGVTSAAGPGNSFKTAVSFYLNMVVAENIDCFQFNAYDTEGSMSYTRINAYAARFPKLSAIDHGSEILSPDDIKITITSLAEMLGDVYFEEIRKLVAAKQKLGTKIEIAVPFVNMRGEHLKIITPTGVLIDSISELKVSANEEKFIEKNAIGDSANNILYMRQGIAKKQLITQLPGLNAAGGIFFTMVAHIGDEFELDAYAPKKHKLTHSKKGSKVTGATKAFDFINNALYEIFSATVLNNKERNTGVLYPLSDSDRLEDCIDLNLVVMKITRNKSGPSGVWIPLIISQREGLLPHLTCFHFIKENKKFGMTGNNMSYSLDIYPDVKLSRTTVRKKVDEDYMLCRALEITSEMLQIIQCWKTLPDGLMCSPADLYTDLITLGYDWNVLLNTRSYWVPIDQESKEELNELTTMDLLRMRKGLYKPYWLDGK